MKRLLFSVCLAFLFLFLVFPLGQVVYRAFFFGGAFSTAVFKAIAGNLVVRESVINSLVLSFLTVGAATLIGLPLAFLFSRYTFPGRDILRPLFFLPMLVSPFIGAIGMRQILSRFGSLNLLLMKAHILSHPVSWLGSGFWGILIIETLHLYPIMFLNLSAALNSFDAGYEEASASVGASSRQTFRYITFPLLLPGYFAAASIVFVWTLTDLGTPLVFEFTRLIPVQIFNALTDINVNPAGYGMVVIVTAIVLLLFWFTKRMIEQTPFTTQKSQFLVREQKAGRLRCALAYGSIAVVLFCSLLPHAAVILTSVAGRWFFSVLPTAYTGEFYRTALSHHLTKTGLLNSVVYSGASTFLDLVLGCVIGFLLVRSTLKGKNVLDLLAMLPLAVPGVVLAFGYISCFSNTLLDPRNNPVPLLIISYSIRRLPYLVRATHAGFLYIHPSMEEASYGLGANGLTTFRRIVLPLLKSGLFAGAVLTFAFSVLEVSSSLILAMRERYYPLAKTIYLLAGRITDGPYVAAALGVIGMAALGIALGIASRVSGRGMGEFFRTG